MWGFSKRDNVSSNNACLPRVNPLRHRADDERTMSVTIDLQVDVANSQTIPALEHSHT